MLARENPAYESQDLRAEARALRKLGRPSTPWGWLLWIFIALLFFLLISYVIVPWWYAPAPTDVPPPNSNTMKT